AGLDGVAEGESRGAGAAEVVDGAVGGAGLERQLRHAGDDDGLREVDVDVDRGAGRVGAVGGRRGDAADGGCGGVDDEGAAAGERAAAREGGQGQGGVVGRGVLDRAGVEGERARVDVVEVAAGVAGLDGVL